MDFDIKFLIYSVAFILLFGIITSSIVTNFYDSKEVEYIPFGVTFISQVMGNNLQIIDEHNLDFLNNFTFLNTDDETFFYNFKDNFPNYIEMDELKHKQTRELRFIPTEITINGEVVVYFQYYKQQFLSGSTIYFARNSTFFDKLKCSIKIECDTTENFALYSVNRQSFSSNIAKGLSIFNPFNYILNDEMKNKIDENLLMIGFLPKVIGDFIGFMLALIYLTISSFLTYKFISLIRGGGS